MNLTKEQLREQTVMAGVRVLLKKALKEVGGYWTAADAVESLAEQARAKMAPVEDVVDQWAAASLVGWRIRDNGRTSAIEKGEADLMNEMARRCLEVFRGGAR